MAANPLRGEVDVTIPGPDGTEKTYTLRLTTNALCSLQARTGKTVVEFLGTLSSIDYTALRELMLAALKPYHQKQFPDLEKVGNFMDDAGGLGGLMPAIKALFDLNLKPRTTEAVEEPSEASDPNG